MKGGRIRVRRSKTRARGKSLYNWVVEDQTGGKVFTRTFVFAFFEAAINEAQRLARTGQIKPSALQSVQKHYDVPYFGTDAELIAITDEVFP